MTKILKNTCRKIVSCLCRVLFTTVGLLPLALFGQSGKGKHAFNDLIQPSLFALTRVMMHDVVNPPAASRFYAYSLLGAYHILSHEKDGPPPLQKLLNNFPLSGFPDSVVIANREITALFCILETGKLMLPSGYLLEKDEVDLIAKLRKRKVNETLLRESREAARLIAISVGKFAAGDAYTRLSAKLRYTPKQGDGYWYPTPPSYLEAVEPNWKTIRPMIIDSCNQFVPARPAVFNRDSTSQFFKLVKEVYDISNHLTPEQLQIAAFWDCNPFAIDNAGHLAIGFKKISPGGHWINIACVAAAKAKLSFTESVTLETMVSLALMDAFISCWDEKYRSHRIRPETVINKQINIRWQPLLQTPPFPEYPSGHSVISTAAAEVLSYFLGDSFTYTDDTELIFEIPARSFHSFRQAAAEASISRLFGGIHFRDAIENGQLEGKMIGAFVVSRIRKSGLKPFRY
jgi:PAP2 superfamily protein